MSASSVARISAQTMASRQRLVRYVLTTLLLACSLLGSACVLAQATGAAMNVQVVLTSFSDNDHNGKVSLGDVLTYTATATNTGTTPLTNVQFLGLGLAPCASVAVGASCADTFTYTVVANDVAQGEVFESVSATANELPSGVNSPEAITPVFGGPDLTFTEALVNNTDPGHTGGVMLGDVLTYTVTATNSGGVTLTSVSLSDPLLAPNAASCANVAVGASCTLTGKHTVSAADVSHGQIVDRPAVTSNPTIVSGFPYGDEFVTPVAAASGAAMSVSIDVDKFSNLVNGQIVAGSQAQFIVTATNAGDQPLTHVTVSNPSANPSSIVCPNVAVGTTCVLTSTYTVTASDVSNGFFGPLVGSATSTQVVGPVTSSSFRAPIDQNSATVLQVIGGNGQTGAPGSTLSGLAVQLQGSGVANQVIVFTVLSGSAKVTSSEAITNGQGVASTNLVLGASPGPVNVLAQLKYQSTEAFFSENNGTLLAGTLSIVSGNNQQLGINAQSAQLVVQLTRSGAPVAHATIYWSGSGATPTNATSITDNNGRATNTATVQQAGAASVSAESPTPFASPVTFQVNGDFTSVAGLTPPEIQVANALDHACPALAGLATLTPAQQDFLAQCRALAAVSSTNPGQVANALNQMLPHDALLQTSASVLVTTAQFDNIKSRLAALRSGSTGASFGGLAFATPDGSLPVGSLSGAALGLDDKPADKKQEVGSGFDRWGFFATGSFGDGSADPRSATPGYGFHTDGLTAGVDYRFSDHLIFGISAGYANYSSNVDQVGGGMDTHGWSMSAYSTFFRQDNWYVDAVLTYGRNSYDINRRIVYELTTTTGTDTVNQTAASNSSGNTFAAAMTFGRDFAKEPWSLGPYLRGTYSRTDFGDFAETPQSGAPGSGLGLAVDGRDVTTVSSIVGGKVNYASSQNWGVLMPHAEIEWEHEFKDSPDALTAHFLQDPTATPFTLNGDAIDTNFFRLGLGLSFQFSHGRSGFVYYERLLGMAGVTQNTISAGFRMEF